jgi:hypothetical protein
VIAAAGKNAADRRVNLTNVCWTSEKFFFFSRAVWLFENPLVTFSGFGSITGRRAVPSQIEDFMRQRHIQELRTGPALVFDCPRISPLDWDWVRKTAAPLALMQSQRSFETLLALRWPEDLSFLQKIGNVVAVNDHSPTCVEFSEVHHLTQSEAALEYFRSFMIEDIQVTDSVIILESNLSLFNVTNLADLARVVCEECTSARVVAEEIDPLNLVPMIAEARFVIAGYSTVLSQALWIQGTLIEIVPDGTQCQSWTFDVTQVAGVRHLRFTVGNSTELAPRLTEQCPGNITHLYNATVAVSPDAVVAAVKE